MASELSKLIEDQLQKHDEEAPLSPTDKQRLLSSSLRIKTSPGRKQEKRSPIVKLNKEQPQAPSISGTSVPVPSGQSWVTEDNQKFKWTWKRIALAVFTVAAIIVALLVAFSHPSSKIHHPDLSAYSEGSNTSGPMFGGLLGRGKAPQAAPPVASAKQPPASLYGSGPGAQEAGVNAGLGASSEAVPSTSHQKPHSGQHHSSHGKKHQHSTTGSEGGAGAPGSQALAGASGGSKVGAGGSAAVLAGAMHDLAAAGRVPVPAPGPAGGPLASVLPPAGVPIMASGLGPLSMAPVPARAKGVFGQSAGIYTVPGVAGNPHSLPRSASGEYPSNEAWDELHGGGVQQQQGVEGVASVAGGPGTRSEGLGDTEEDYDEELGFDEEANEEEIDNEELEVAGGYPGSSYAEDDGGIAG
ncbi:hypothetical protein CVIRNUC_005153 [Coccomyxa viridis]|uniref:Transmembrane protein n=1 Tax=Coccomyxa viridis TaxID=1274662 RepID=A0AAV1I662_9CHLO|nr:hypothetical protein CVIRNUC_005153 [Coccomyxa viridis]